MEGDEEFQELVTAILQRERWLVLLVFFRTFFRKTLAQGYTGIQQSRILKRLNIR